MGSIRNDTAINVALTAYIILHANENQWLNSAWNMIHLHRPLRPHDCLCGDWPAKMNGGPVSMDGMGG